MAASSPLRTFQNALKHVRRHVGGFSYIGQDSCFTLKLISIPNNLVCREYDRFGNLNSLKIFWLQNELIQF